MTRAKAKSHMPAVARRSKKLWRNTSTPGEYLNLKRSLQVSHIGGHLVTSLRREEGAQYTES